MTRIEVLGGLRIRHEGRWFENLPRKKAIALVGLLALRPKLRQAREKLADALWPESTTEVGRERLRKTLHWFRANTDGATFLLSDADALWLSDEVETDFAELLVRLEKNALETVEPALLRELLPGCYEDPIVEERNRLEALLEEIRLRPRMETGEPKASSFPVFLTSFVGRDDEAAKIQETLASPETRLLTLWGPGGVGKTRLACALAERTTQRALFLELGSLAPHSSAERIHLLLADTLGRPADAREPVTDWIRHQLVPSRCLLVLDNAEHLLDGASQVARSLLASCPYLQVLATSRRPLELPGEVVWPLSPLDEPDAVALFQARGKSSAPKAEISRETLKSLCDRLDGLPLVIELAAAHLRWLTPSQLESGLADRRSLLATGRDAPERHRSLDAAIERSWLLLDEPERRLFSRLAVFPASFTIKAALEIGDADWATLESLVSHSLVMPGERFSMLDSLREFAGARLRDRGERDELRERFRRFFTDLMAETVRAGWPQNQAEVIRLFRLERANFRRALDGEVVGGESSLYEHLPFLWDRCGEIDEALDALDSGLSRIQDPKNRLGLMGWRGHFLIGARRYAEALAQLEELKSLLKDGEKRHRLPALLALGHAYLDVERWTDAACEFEEALAICDDDDDLWRSQALAGRGDAHLGRGSFDIAEEDYHAAIDAGQRSGVEVTEGVAHLKLGRLLRLQRRYSEMDEALGRVREIARRLDDLSLERAVAEEYKIVPERRRPTGGTFP